MNKKTVLAAILSSTGAFVLAATFSFGMATSAQASTVQVASATEIISVSGAGGVLAG